MPAQTGLFGSLLAGWQATVRDQGLEPFIQNASTPTMSDTLTNALQQLAGGKATVDQFLALLQADFDKYHQQ
jgi:raffinose/stachyose/melibiose transport system substrate-binding protein